MERPEDKPSGVCHDEFGPCDDCNRDMLEGEPYWGGGLDYWGEANDARCKSCQINLETWARDMDCEIDQMAARGELD